MRHFRGAITSLTTLGIVVSVFVEWAAAFLSMSGSDSWPDSVHRTTYAATSVWTATCLVAIVLLVRTWRVEDGGHNTLVAKTMMLFAGGYVVVFWSQIHAINSSSQKKANPFTWFFYALPGCLWMLSGFIAAKRENVEYETLERRNSSSSVVSC